MSKTPIYDDIIIVGIIFDKTFNWYITNKLYWIMDLEKLSKEEYLSYFNDSELNEIRKNIPILSEKNIESFLNKIENCKVNINNFRLQILDALKLKNDESELEEYYPALLLDFDKHILYSQYPEPFGFENYVPHNWEGKYISFLDYIIDENKYWMYKNKNLLI